MTLDVLEAATLLDDDPVGHRVPKRVGRDVAGDGFAVGRRLLLWDHSADRRGAGDYPLDAAAVTRADCRLGNSASLSFHRPARYCFSVSVAL